MKDTYDILDIDESRITALMDLCIEFQCAVCSPTVLEQFANMLDDYTGREKAYVLAKVFNFADELSNKVDLAKKLLTRDDAISNTMVEGIMSLFDSIDDEETDNE